MRTDNDKKFSLYFFYTKLEDMINFKTEIDILIFVFPLNDRFIFDLIVNSWPEKNDDSLKKVPIFLVGITNEELNYNNDNPQFLKWEEVEEFQEDKENICQAIKCKYNDKDFMYLKNMLIEALKYVEGDGNNHNRKHKHKHKKKIRNAISSKVDTYTSLISYR
ncbi:hypothetical protein M9Y10_039451 [Tritrichomonas musculus]|uniref:Uncharacterized protein n=1 Tax=Tritrichomonas musculus TaxID=1915356 RepID=A0ABR2KCC1_9EUKA